MRPRFLRIAFAFFLLSAAARPAFAEEIDFQSAVGSDAPGQTSQAGGGGATADQVQTIDLNEVTGTVCDCGEIEPPEGVAAPAASKGGFPKFPLYAAAAGPGAICLFSNICSPGRTMPTPTPPPSNVPEPFTLATLSAGLAALAGLRARRRRA